MVKTTFLLFISISLFVSYSSAQILNNLSSKRIFLYNGLALKYDEKKGVKKLLSAIDSYENAGYISDSKLKKDSKIQKERYEKRYKAIVQPVLDEIEKIIDQIELSNDIFLLDGAELEESGNLLAFNSRLNISDSLALTLNDFFDGNLNTVIKLGDFPYRIASIDTTKIENLDKTFPYFQMYLKEKRISLIFDSSKQNPSVLKDFPIDDITKDFISYYNQVKQ